MVPNMVPRRLSMGRKEKLLQKARNSPKSLKYKDLCKLAEYFGYEFRNQEGSHETYKHPKTKSMMNFQPTKNGEAKPFQVKQLLAEIERFNLIGGKNG